MKIELALLKQTVDTIVKDMEHLVTDKEFAPIQRIVYGFIGLILIAFGTAVVATYIK